MSGAISGARVASVTSAVADSRALVGYLPVGFPDLATSIDAAVALIDNGFDAIELGLPYSDPVMDGLTIQQATERALANGFRVRDVFTAVEAVRNRVDAPVLVMTYWNPVVQYGVARFADHLQPVVHGQQGDQAAAKQGVVVHHHQGDGGCRGRKVVHGGITLPKMLQTVRARQRAPGPRARPPPARQCGH